MAKFFIVLIIASLLFFIGLAFGRTLASDNRTPELDAVIDRLQASFVDQSLLDIHRLNQAAIDGVIDYIDDPYTNYMSPSRVKDFNDTLQGLIDSDFEGIGASVTERDGNILILGPLPGSPAASAGILPGDVVLAVDGIAITDKTLDEVVSYVRGPKDTVVVLTISRVGVATPFDLEIRRATISIGAVLARMHSKHIGYIQISRFDATVPDDFRSAIRDLKSLGAKGFVLDLRNNGGGLVSAAVAVVSEFVENGEVLRWVEADGNETVENVTNEGIAFDSPLVVIVNNFSASGSEVVVGALQDHKRAIIVGTRTFGKGSVNALEILDSGAGLYVTIARWFTPNGRQIEGIGLEPDVILAYPLNMQLLAEIGMNVTRLCEIFSSESESMKDYPELIESLNQLCNNGSTTKEINSSDLFLQSAVDEMNKLLGS